MDCQHKKERGKKSEGTTSDGDKGGDLGYQRRPGGCVQQRGSKVGCQTGGEGEIARISYPLGRNRLFGQAVLKSGMGGPRWSGKEGKSTP